MGIVHNLSFTIAVGAGRWAKTWRNTETTWAAFLARIRDTVRTGETVAEYKAMSKADKDAKKDVGGFVGGTLQGGRRLQTHVVSRQLVSLDADNPGKDFLFDVDLALGNSAWAVYSTHSHRPESPRLRLIIPLTNPVSPDMYQAIARRIAADVGIDQFDPTTYDVHRLMYWPSSPQNGEYVFQYNDAPALDPGTVLARYHDWQDAAEWPVGAAEVRARKLTAKKQGDPLTKPGLIGAFNRAYTMSEAIDAYLSGVYEPTVHEDRYTYAAGSTAAGLVLYDGVFAYSHHGTDPASGKLCNAFDLVRIHLFGEKDADTDESVPINKRPSFLAMAELAGHDKRTVHELNREELKELREQFDDAELIDGEDYDDSWLDDLERGQGKNAAIKPTAENFILILTHDKFLKDKFGLDEFSHRILLKADLPWHKVKDGVIWRDADDASLRNYLSKYYRLTGRGVIDDALTEVISRNRFHPVRDYLKGLTWDGTPRAETLYIDYLGAEDSAYTRMVTKQHLKAAVARVMQPGVKFDPCLVLSGPQGIGKSTILAKLGRQWFNDSIVSLQGKDPMEQLQGSWIIELSEMQATNKSENDQIKAFISRQVDKFRAPYGRRTEEFPRQCVFAATTNDYVFLKDRTGGRRFWPIFVRGGGNMTVLQLTSAIIDQIWAEVYESYKQDPNLQLTPEIAAIAAELQKAHTEGSEKAGMIEDYLNKKLPEDWDTYDLYDRRAYLEEYDDKDPRAAVVRDRVCVLEIWCEAMNGARAAMTNAIARELNGLMQSMDGWEPHRSKSGNLRFGNLYGLQRAYVRVK